MKAFIVAALLVASVAGQSLDMYKTMNKDMVISKKGLMRNHFLKNFYGGDYSNMINGDYYNNEYPSNMENYFGGEEDMYNVLSYEQVTVHPMFREYMSLPLFRQYWSYPMFQRYVCSHYFQRFWTMPAFQQYFVQPALFYKYIYPMVQLFKYDAVSTTSNNFYYPGGDYSIRNKNVYPIGADYFQGQQQQFNQGLPTICYSNAMYCRALVQKMYNHLMYNTPQETVSTPMDFNNDMYKYNQYYSRMSYPTVYNKEFYPTVYNKDFVPTVYNKEFLPTVYNKEFVPTVYNKDFVPTVYNKEFYPTVYNKEFVPTVYNKEFYPTVYNKDFVPTVYNKEFLPTVYNKEFVPTVYNKDFINNEDMIRPVFSANTYNKAMIGDKIAFPEQVIKA